MSWMKHTGSPYHTQDTGYYCGAASAMMILAEIGVPYSDLDQDDLYDSNHSHNAAPTGWATDPYGLRFTLIDRRPPGFHRTFVVQKPTSEGEGTRDLVYTLHRYGVSPAVLVYGCQHWIVVPGVQTDVEPVGAADYTVEGFWLNNPVYHSAAPPPPHDASDGCGTGGTLGDANEFVTYAGWQSTYFTGCNYDNPAGSAQFISVCDPDVRNIKLPRRRERKILADGRRLINIKKAVEFSKSGIAEYNLEENRNVIQAMKGTEPDKPLVVVRLDRPNTSYYLIPWKVKDRVTALTQVDARFGIFQSLHLIKKPKVEKFLSTEDVMERVAYKKFEFPDIGRIILDPDLTCLSPALVWKPCWESWSPNMPFYQLTIGTNTLYIRIDGEIFTKLTTTGRGT